MCPIAKMIGQEKEARSRDIFEIGDVGIGRIRYKVNKNRNVSDFTFDVILFDRRAAIGRFLDIGTVALFVDDAPACKIARYQFLF